MLLPYLKVPNGKMFYDDKYTLPNGDPIFIEPGVDEDRYGNRYWPIDHSTTLDDLVKIFNDNEFPRGAKLIWVDER